MENEDFFSWHNVKEFITNREIYSRNGELLQVLTNGQEVFSTCQAQNP